MSEYDKYIKKIQKLKSSNKKQKKDDLDVKSRHLKALIEIATQIVRDINLEDVLRLVLENAVNLTNADRGFIMLCDNKGVWKYKIGIDSKFSPLPSDKFCLSMSVINQVAEKKEIIFIENVIKEKEFKEKKSIKELGLKMILAAPLETNGNVIGALYVDSITPVKSFTKGEKHLFEIYTNFASIAITNARLYESSLTDPLTGLPNLSSFYLKLDEEISRAQRYGGNISVLMLDLDNFKAINYTYGYLFGNRVLEAVGQLIGDSVRKPDFAARFGGDEFILFLPQTDARDAKTLAERLLEKIKMSFERIDEAEISLNASIGIVSFPGTRLSTKEELIVEVENVLNLSKNQGGGVFTLIDYRNSQPLPEEIVGVSTFYRGLSKQVEDFSKSKTPCLILGETGVGKELIAGCIHKSSKRKDAPFIVVNCTAIPENLLEDELFGHEKGSFTGAIKQRKGKFELANKGTLFLDEIGDISLSFQAKLLRVIEDNNIYRLGGDKPITIDVRVISATNKNLENMVGSERFRKDLFYRLNAFTLNIPPLRERKDDILTIAEFYLKIYARIYKKSFCGFTDGAKEELFSHPWYGNVRELKHVIEKAVIIGKGKEISDKDIALQLHKDGHKILKEVIEETERREIEKALRTLKGNISRTATALGISRQTLRKKLYEYKIEL